MRVLVQETIVVPSQFDQLATLHAALECFWAAVDKVVLQPPDMLWRLKFATAVAEIGTNIMQHAYGAGNVQGEIGLRLRLFSNRMEARFTDYGAAFSGVLERLPPLDTGEPFPTQIDIMSLPEHGYGLALVHGLVDDVQYRRTRDGINCWRLRKDILA
ncbi:MAG: ATP-binding protein [Chloroflexota bacterium]|nr:ATP-binding protein [Chloroflexota bacterium]PLS78724.1 MAG: hypothetical protein CYG59_16985 [Chloroflexota bacterium]